MGRTSLPMLRHFETGCALALLASIVVLVSVASIARAVGSPIIWSIEIAQLLFVWLCMISADLTLQKQRHFSLSVLPDSLGPEARRWLEMVNRLVLLGLLGFLLVYAVRNTQLMHTRFDGATQMRGSWIHGSMVIGLMLFLRTLASQIIRIWHNPPEAAATEESS